MATTQTDVQESAQALFCALANKHGVSSIDTTFNKDIYPSYLQFKENWNKTYKTATIEKTFSTHVKSGKATLKDVEDLLYGVGKKTAKEKNAWYYSSLQIAKQLIKDITTISTKFNYVKTGNWSNVFWAHGDPEVMENFIKLYNKANAFQAQLAKSGNKNVERPFSDINKWSTADIYFASDKAKREIENMVKEKKLDYTRLNAFVGRLISEGNLLPLSLKKQPNEVTIKKVNFNRPQEQKAIQKLEFAGFSDWKVYDPEKDINTYTRTLYMYMAKDKSMFSQLRHDPSANGYKGVVQLKISTAYEGSLSAGLIEDLLNMLDSGFGTKWYAIYKEANTQFIEKKKFLDKELKSRDRKEYVRLREIDSAAVTNVVNPPLMDWLNANQNRADLFVRALYTYATARSVNSSKYVIAK